MSTELFLLKIKLRDFKKSLGEIQRQGDNKKNDNTKHFYSTYQTLVQALNIDWPFHPHNKLRK